MKTQFDLKDIFYPKFERVSPNESDQQPLFEKNVNLDLDVKRLLSKSAKMVTKQNMMNESDKENK